MESNREVRPTSPRLSATHTLWDSSKGPEEDVVLKEGEGDQRRMMKTYDIKVKRGLYGQGRGSAREAGRAKPRERKEESITCV